MSGKDVMPRGFEVGRVRAGYGIVVSFSAAMRDDVKLHHMLKSLYKPLPHVYVSQFSTITHK
jgi:hypothetical protein